MGNMASQVMSRLPKWGNAAMRAAVRFGWGAGRDLNNHIPKALANLEGRVCSLFLFLTVKKTPIPCLPTLNGLWSKIQEV